MEERVQEIEEQLCKLDSDKCVVEVCSHHRVRAVLGEGVQHKEEWELTVSAPAGSGV